MINHGCTTKKYLFIQLGGILTCPEIPEADHGECISCKPKTEKWAYNEGFKILKKFLSHLKPKTSETGRAEGKFCGRSNSVHPIWGPRWFGFRTCVLPGSPVLVQKCVRKHRKKLVSLWHGWWDLLGVDTTSTHLWQLLFSHRARYGVA